MNEIQCVIVTGCAGLFGVNFSNHLLNNGFRVIGIDDLSGGYSEYLPKNENFEFHEFDLSWKIGGKVRLDKIFENNGPIACFHFAAYASEGLSPFIRHFNYQNNVLASVNVINACIKHSCKMIFTSSIAVYGDQKPPFKEDTIPKPIDPYGIAKYTIEMDLAIASNQHGLRYSIVRPHNVIGIYQNIWDRYRNVAGIFINNIINENKPITIYGDGEQTRAFSDIRFYMKPFEKLINDGDGQIFNMGADQYVSVNKLSDIIISEAKRYGYESSVVHMEPRHEAKHAHCDHSKAKSLLSFVDNTNISELIEDIFKWSLNQPKRIQKNINYELEKGMYEYWK
jgi:UDP-glucose 4-epimerase